MPRTSKATTETTTVEEPSTTESVEEPTTETPVEAKTTTRVPVTTVAKDALEILRAAGEKGMGLKELGAALKERGFYEGLDDQAIYRKVHNVTWHLEGQPPTGNKTFKRTFEYTERVSGKTYRVKDDAPEYEVGRTA